MKKSLVILIMIILGLNPCFALDFDAVDNNSSRKTYSNTQPTKPAQTQTQTNTLQNIEPAQPVSVPTVKPTITQEQVTVPEPPTIQNYEKLPNVPKLPDKAFSKTVAPINTMYTGKVPDKNALTPCTDIKVGDLILDERYTKPKFVNVFTPKPTNTKPAATTPPKTIAAANYKYKKLAKGTQFRVVNSTKITDYMFEGERITFKSTHSLKTPYFTVPQGTKFTAIVDDSHKPQMTCNGGLVSLKFVSAEINGYNQQINASVIRIKNDRVKLSNLKGEHTYWKTTCKKAKWGQTKFKQLSKTSSRLADKGAGVIIAPFPYIGGCVLACASTVSSPVTALLGRGGRLIVPANTVFTIKLNEEAKIRY